MKIINKFCKLCFVVLAIIFSCQFTSCEKYLEKKSDKSLATPNTLDDLQALLDNNYIMNANTPGLGETSTDDYFVLPDNYNSLGNLDQKSYTWSFDIYNYPNDWASCYSVIYTANYCLDELNKINKTSANADSWNNIKGSALFYKGYYFLDLAWDYAKAYDSATSLKDLGIVLRTGSDFNIPSVRANVAETYDQIIKDLKEAGLLLSNISAQPVRPSKAAAWGALARTYLSMRIYDSAYTYANAALQIHSDLLDYNSNEVDSSADIPFAPFNKEVVFYTTQSGNYTPKVYYYAAIDTMLISTYDSNDLRSHVFFYIDGGYSYFKGDYAGKIYPPFSGIATDEILLIRAECNVRKGNLLQSMNDLNTLLIKRWMTGTFTPLAISNPADALATILLERRKELLMRGLRWIDIKRLNKENYNIIPERIIGGQTYTLLPNSNYYALPLPADVIKESGILQN